MPFPIETTAARRGAFVVFRVTFFASHSSHLVSSVSRSRRGARLVCGPRRSDGHLLAEVAHEQDGAHEEPRGAEQVLSGSEGGAGGRQTGLVLGGQNTRGANHPGDRGGQRGDTRRERARTMVLSRFGGANSLSMISFKPMIAVSRAVAVRPACLDGPKHAAGRKRRNTLLPLPVFSIENAVADRTSDGVASCSRLSRAPRQCDRRKTCTTTRSHRRRTSHAPHPRPQVPSFDRRVRFENALVGTHADQP